MHISMGDSGRTSVQANMCTCATVCPRPVSVAAIVSARVATIITASGVRSFGAKHSVDTVRAKRSWGTRHAFAAGCILVFSRLAAYDTRAGHICSAIRKQDSHFTQVII